jgi:hypothetical protein
MALACATSFRRHCLALPCPITVHHPIALSIAINELKSKLLLAVKSLDW